MKLLLFFSFLLVGCATTGSSTPATTEPITAKAAASHHDQVVLKAADGVDQAALIGALNGLGAGDVVLVPSTLSWWLATFRPDSPPRDAGAAVVLAEKVAALSEVAVAEPNAKRTTR